MIGPGARQEVAREVFEDLSRAPCERMGVGLAPAPEQRACTFDVDHRDAIGKIVAGVRDRRGLIEGSERVVPAALVRETRAERAPEILACSVVTV